MCIIPLFPVLELYQFVYEPGPSGLVFKWSTNTALCTSQSLLYKTSAPAKAAPTAHVAIKYGLSDMYCKHKVVPVVAAKIAPVCDLFAQLVKNKLIANRHISFAYLFNCRFAFDQSFYMLIQLFSLAQKHLLRLSQHNYTFCYIRREVILSLSTHGNNYFLS